MFIVIEGLDGTGKSTVAKALAQSLDGTALSTPLDKFKPVRESLEGMYRGDALSRQLFYASTVLNATNEIKHLIRETPVVLDRYWLSTQVYHHWKCQGEHLALTEVERKLLVPNLTVYLELPLSVRQQRLSNRAGNTEEDNLTLTSDAHHTLNGLYHGFKQAPIVGRWLSVNADQDIDAIVDEVVEMAGGLMFEAES